jgi:uncharacterized protein
MPRPHSINTTGSVKPFIVITGGSGGIGKALAARFLEAGNAVLLVARDAARLGDAATALSTPGLLVSKLALDITTADATQRIDAHLASLDGYCDVLVNAAGIGLAGAFAAQDPASLDRLVDLNTRALTHLTRHFLPPMLARGRGGVLNIASLGGYAPGPWQAAYYASKAYVISLTEALAHECAGQGVRIAVVCPGPVRTAFHKRMGGDTGLYLRLLPIATPEAVARAAYRWFRLGQRVIIPGFIATAVMPAMRILPHRLLSPLVAFLLKPR